MTDVNNWVKERRPIVYPLDADGRRVRLTLQVSRPRPKMDVDVTHAGYGSRPEFRSGVGGLSPKWTFLE